MSDKKIPLFEMYELEDGEFVDLCGVKVLDVITKEGIGKNNKPYIRHAIKIIAIDHNGLKATAMITTFDSTLKQEALKYKDKEVTIANIKYNKEYSNFGTTKNTKIISLSEETKNDEFLQKDIQGIKDSEKENTTNTSHCEENCVHHKVCILYNLAIEHQLGDYHKQNDFGYFAKDCKYYLEDAEP